MMKSHLLAAIAGGFLVVGLAVSDAQAQAQTRPAGTTSGYRQTAPPNGVALLDLSQVFKQHTRFQSEMDAMKKDVESAEAQMKRKTETLQQWMKQLKESKPGSPDYKQMEAQITKMRSDLQVEMQLMRKDFLEREAGIYNRYYQEIKAEVSYYASQRNLAAVLRFNRSEKESKNPQDVLEEINQPIVWNSPAVDITQYIIDTVNRRSTSGGGTAPMGADRRNNTGVPFPRTN